MSAAGRHLGHGGYLRAIRLPVVYLRGNKYERARLVYARYPDDDGKRRERDNERNEKDKQFSTPDYLKEIR
jgi:hypothetical protein